jgi:hypothetical protein
MESEDADSIKNATDELNELIQQVGAAAYQEAGPEAGFEPEAKTETTPEGESPDDEDVVDGEFQEA